MFIGVNINTKKNWFISNVFTGKNLFIKSKLISNQLLINYPLKKAVF